MDGSKSRRFTSGCFSSAVRLQPWRWPFFPDLILARWLNTPFGHCNLLVTEIFLVIDELFLNHSGKKISKAAAFSSTLLSPVCWEQHTHTKSKNKKLLHINLPGPWNTCLKDHYKGPLLCLNKQRNVLPEDNWWKMLKSSQSCPESKSYSCFILSLSNSNHTPSSSLPPCLYTHWVNKKILVAVNESL